jgi:hypothetical protein
MVRSLRWGCLIMFGFVAFASGVSPAEAQLWKRFVPTTRVEADPQADYRLAESNGPWLIMAATFSGDGAEEQARALVLEFRRRYNLAAYLHHMKFDYAEENPGRGIDHFGAPIRRRYQREQAEQFAVLAGDFPAIDDPNAQEQLERVKKMEPEALRLQEDGKTAQTLIGVRVFQDAVLKSFNINRKRGPMAQAFLARNPVLPDEYFVPKGVDPFVAKMNEGVEFSLLDCPGDYTVRVATYRGRTILQTASSTNAASKSRRAQDSDDSLVEAAENAHLLTELLRKHGWEAYEFHDRTESIVTIGSFSEAGVRLPDGRVVAAPAVQRIIETFGAAYDTPADPLGDASNEASVRRRVDEQGQLAVQQLRSQPVQVVAGLNPKHVKTFRGSGMNRKLDRVFPMDIHPQAIEVPKRPSLSGVYAR